MKIHRSDNNLHGVYVVTYYALVEGQGTLYYQSPIDGFVGIFVINNTHASIYDLCSVRYVLHKGENILHKIKKNDAVHWLGSDPGASAIILFIPDGLLQDLHHIFNQQEERFKNGFLTKGNHRLKLIIDRLKELIQMDREGQVNRLLIKSALLEAVAHHIEELYVKDVIMEPEINRAHFEMIQQAKTIIDADVTKNYTIAELAKQVGTNEQYLKKYFKQQHGLTVMSYITKTKMEHAKSLITKSNYRISDVARMTGYKHSTHFTTAFKRFFGFIPNSLRYILLMVQGSFGLLGEVEGLLLVC